MSGSIRVAMTMVLAFAGATAAARSFCPTSHFVPSANFDGEMTTWLAQPLPAVMADDEDLLLSYTEADTADPDREAIYEVFVLEDRAHDRVALVDAPKAARPAIRAIAVVTSRPLASSLATRIHHAAESILRRTRYDPAPPHGAGEPSLPLCTDGFWAYTAAGRVAGHDLLAGEVYSPPSTSEAGAMVSLGRALRRYAQGRLDERGLEAPLAAAESHARP